LALLPAVHRIRREPDHKADPVVFAFGRDKPSAAIRASMLVRPIPRDQLNRLAHIIAVKVVHRTNQLVFRSFSPRREAYNVAFIRDIISLHNSS
jgi:hypothetical protein